MAAIQNRKLPIPENTEEFHEIHDKEARTQDEILQRTEQFRYICYQKFQSYLTIYILRETKYPTVYFTDFWTEQQ